MTRLVGYILTTTNNNYSVLFTLIPCSYFVALGWVYLVAPRRQEMADEMAG